MKPKKINGKCVDGVYCEKCKYYRFYSGPFGSSEWCMAEVTLKSTYTNCDKTYAKPSLKNKNNNCKDYELKYNFIKRLLRDRN